MPHQANTTAAAGLFGCATILAVAQLLTGLNQTDYSVQDHVLRRTLARAAARIVAPLQRCYADQFAVAQSARDGDRDQGLMLAGLACNGGVAALSGG
jgi:hypothetical protein